MSAFLDEQYFSWLYGLVGVVKQRDPSRTHWSLAKQLYQKEFVWWIPNDDNRCEDGRDLRREFLNANGFDEADPDWLDLGCSMLELLIGISRRLAFETEDDTSVWFWHLIEVLDMEQYNDKKYDDKVARRIDRALDRVIWRTYAPDGRGGLFPLNHPERDQREVEIWYQLSAYLLELDPI